MANDGYGMGKGSITIDAWAAPEPIMHGFGWHAMN